ncbi:hypothetical protein GMSM_03260 [Geomonas sp. Red276]
MRGWRQQRPLMPHYEARASVMAHKRSPIMGKIIWGWSIVYAVVVGVYGMYLLKKYLFSKDKK